MAVTVNGDRYRAMLNEILFTKIEEDDIGNIWFQQEGATCRTCSPDMNIIQNAYCFLIQKVYSDNRQFTSVEDFKLKIIEVWGKIDEKILNYLYKSMKNRIFNLISSKEGLPSFKY